MKNKNKFLNNIREFGIIIVLMLLIAFFMIVTPAFRKPRILLNVIKQASVNGILASGMMFVIISGGIDLSAGSTVALAGVISALVSKIPNTNIAFAILAGVITGALVGFINGFGVAYAKLPPFIITLATMTGVRGLALIISKGSPIYGLPEAFETFTSIFAFNSIPILVVYFVIIILLSGFILNKTIFGRYVYAIGGNEVSAKVSGISVNRIKLKIYGIAGALSGLAGVLVASRTTQGSPTAGAGYEMDAISAVVIGGISMAGGSGKWYGTAIGALLLAVMSSGMDILGVNTNYQSIIKGLIIAIAVYFDLKGKDK